MAEAGDDVGKHHAACYRCYRFQREVYFFPLLYYRNLLIALHSSVLIARTKEKCKFPSETESDRIISGMRYFGLFSSDGAIVRGGNLLDTLCGQLAKFLSFKPGERDLVILQHKFVVEWEDGKRVSNAQCRTSSQKMALLFIFCHLVSILRHDLSRPVGFRGEA